MLVPAGQRDVGGGATGTGTACPLQPTIAARCATLLEHLDQGSVENPVVKLLLQAALQHHRVCGDGAGTFVLLINAAMREVLRLGADQGKYGARATTLEMSHCLHHIASTTLPAHLLPRLQQLCGTRHRRVHGRGENGGAEGWEDEAEDETEDGARLSSLSFEERVEAVVRRILRYVYVWPAVPVVPLAHGHFHRPLPYHGCVLPSTQPHAAYVWL